MKGSQGVKIPQDRRFFSLFPLSVTCSMQATGRALVVQTHICNSYWGVLANTVLVPRNSNLSTVTGMVDVREGTVVGAISTIKDSEGWFYESLYHAITTITRYQFRSDAGTGTSTITTKRHTMDYVPLGRLLVTRLYRHIEAWDVFRWMSWESRTRQVSRRETDCLVVCLMFPSHPEQDTGANRQVPSVFR
jgi:hypothetical protein